MVLFRTEHCPSSLRGQLPIYSPFNVFLFSWQHTTWSLGHRFPLLVPVRRSLMTSTGTWSLSASSSVAVSPGLGGEVWRWGRAAPAHPSPIPLYIDKHPLSFLLCQRSRCKMLPKITPFPASFFLFLLFPHFFYYYSYYIIIIIILLGICYPQSPIPTPWTVSTPWLI